MPSDESKGSQLDAIGSLAQRQLDNTVPGPPATDIVKRSHRNRQRLSAFRPQTE